MLPSSLFIPLPKTAIREWVHQQRRRQTYPTKEFKKGIISKSTPRPGTLDGPTNNPRHPDQVNAPIP